MEPSNSTGPQSDHPVSTSVAPSGAPSSSSTPTNKGRWSELPGWAPPLFFLLLSLLFLWRSSFTNEVFLPARLLGHIAPWNSVKSDPLPPWNPLRWDGIAQFYPWRNFAHETLRRGQIPLWNPYQFCGTPFVANSQSAVFYPGNLLFYLLPTMRAFGVSAVLHLTLCGWFTYLLLRRLGAGQPAALLAGVAYAFSSWQIQWLQLPTFLATSCWIPLLLRQVHILSVPNKNRTGSLSPAVSNWLADMNPVPIAASLGMMLLGGHLQIAFYGLLTGCLFAICLIAMRIRQAGPLLGLRLLGSCLVGLALGFLLALPQVLPALELSRMSHRQGSPNAAGYSSYVALALPTGNLITLTVPEFLGNDYDPANPYYGFYVAHPPEGQPFAVRHNAAETAVYVGIIPLALALLAIVRQLLPRFPVKRTAPTPSASTPALPSPEPWNLPLLFFLGLALGAMLLALGTPLNKVLYFGVPGFGQSGSPARCLTLWALAISVLAGFGLDGLLRRAPTRQEVGITVGLMGLLCAIGLSLVAGALRAEIPLMNELNIPVLGEAMGRVSLGWLRTALLLGTGAGVLLYVAQTALSAKQNSDTRKLLIAPIALLTLTILDLFVTGIGVNPTAPPEAVYPTTPGIRYLQAHTDHTRIFPVNKLWSMIKPPRAVLPPNAATVYGLRDVQGYDSLLTGRYKQFADTYARPGRDGSLNASPPEVGNMVFFQNPLNPTVSELDATYAITLPTSTPDFGRIYPPGVAPDTQPVYNEADELTLFPLPSPTPRAHLQRQDGTTLPAQISYLRDDATRVELTVDATEDATLILADSYYPGWVATVDGRSTPRSTPIEATRTNGVFRSIRVPQGNHTITFHYEPSSYRIGLYLSLFSLSLLAILHVLSISCATNHKQM